MRAPSSLVASVRLVLAFALVIVLGMATPVSARLDDGPSSVPAQIETELLRLVNVTRTEHGLAPLRPDPTVASTARRWAREIVRSRRLRHDPDFHNELTGWTAIGENVGSGPLALGPANLDAAFSRSAGHLANCLRSDYQLAGIGAAVEGPLLVVVVRFVAPEGGGGPLPPRKSPNAVGRT